MNSFCLDDGGLYGMKPPGGYFIVISSSFFFSNPFSFLFLRFRSLPPFFEPKPAFQPCRQMHVTWTIRRRSHFPTDFDSGMRPRCDPATGKSLDGLVCELGGRWDLFVNEFLRRSEKEDESKLAHVRFGFFYVYYE